jgi:hypothetical protein
VKAKRQSVVVGATTPCGKLSDEVPWDDVGNRFVAEVTRGAPIPARGRRDHGSWAGPVADPWP